MFAYMYIELQFHVHTSACLLQHIQKFKYSLQYERVYLYTQIGVRFDSDEYIIGKI
jgi:hypothetical protein